MKTQNPANRLPGIAILETLLNKANSLANSALKTATKTGKNLLRKPLTSALLASASLMPYLSQNAVAGDVRPGENGVPAVVWGDIRNSGRYVVRYINSPSDSNRIGQGFASIIYINAGTNPISSVELEMSFSSNQINFQGQCPANPNVGAYGLSPTNDFFYSAEFAENSTPLWSLKTKRGVLAGTSPDKLVNQMTAIQSGESADKYQVAIFNWRAKPCQSGLAPIKITNTKLCDLSGNEIPSIGLTTSVLLGDDYFYLTNLTTNACIILDLDNDSQGRAYPSICVETRNPFASAPYKLMRSFDLKNWSSLGEAVHMPEYKKYKIFPIHDFEAIEHNNAFYNVVR